jgi:TolB-like protein/tetratricopeptide (TPR) repeat protein
MRGARNAGTVRTFRETGVGGGPRPRFFRIIALVWAAPVLAGQKGALVTERLDRTDRLRSPRPDPSPEAVRAQLARLLDSAVFQGSQRRRDLLGHLVNETLAGRGDQLKGYSVALAVFGRGEDFDPGADPVVRLEAGRLRHALDAYYVDADARDQVRITIPKGAYRVHFAWLAREASPPPVDAPAPAIGPSPSPDASRPPIPSEPPAPPRVDPPPRRRRPVILGAALLLALLSLAGLSWLWLRGAAPVGTEARGPAIIVLPFEALDPSDETRLFATAVTQDLILDLMRFPDFRLYSARTSFREQSNADPVAVGRDLGVSYVLRGSVQSGPGKLRLDARLVDAATGEVIWSDSYDRALDPNDLLGMRSKLSESVAIALGEPYGVVNAAMNARLSAADAPAMASYACVLRANEYRRAFQNALFAPALDCLEEAVVRDPDYADAWAMLGWLNLDAARQDMLPVAQHPASLAAAYDAAARAVSLDPRNQRGLEALAAVAFHNGDFAEAERRQRAALALNPYDPETLAQLGWRLAVRGDWNEGLAYLDQAIARSADPPGWYFHLISVHDYMRGDYAGALAAAEHSTRTGSAIGLSLSAISRAGLGDKDGAARDIAAMTEAWPELARDPAAAYGRFHATDEIIATLVAGLRDAGLKPSVAETGVTERDGG